MLSPRHVLAVAAAFAGALRGPATAHAQPKLASVEIPHDQFTLPNGLRVIVHTDRKAPIVAVNVWYHVGSKDEPRGRTGFAHLFEHLMFQGSENHKGEFFAPFEQVGATEQNGSTNTDRTNYYQNVPTTALDLALWMESDRMGHLVGAIDQATLDEQRGIVQNEKRQRAAPPYALAPMMIQRQLYPADHPYHHSPIGSMADLGAAKLDDVKNWFRSWYGPNNAVLVLAGDIDLATAKDKVTRYFGDLAPSANVTRMAPRVAARTAASRMVTTDRVPQTRIIKAWTVPAFGSPELGRLRVAAQVLGMSDASRLDRRLRFTEKLVDLVTMTIDARELASVVTIVANVSQGVDPAKVEAAIDEEIARLASAGPTADELARAKMALYAGAARGVESIGGEGGKSDVLARCAVFAGDPACFRKQLAALEVTTAAQVKAASQAWLARGAFTLQIDPGERPPVAEEPAIANLPATTVAPPARGLRALPSVVDRSLGVPKVESFPALRFPPIARAVLPNGLRLVLAARRGAPVTYAALQFAGAGLASEPAGKPGAAGLALALLSEGAGGDDALAFAARSERLGAAFQASLGLDAASLVVTAPGATFDGALALLADAALRPRLDPKDLERLRAARLAQIEQAKASPEATAVGLVAPSLFGPGHPYAIQAGGLGTAASVSALSRDDLAGWLTRAIRPDAATLIVVGDLDLATLTRKAEAAFAGWAVPASPRLSSVVPAVKLPPRPRVLLVDQPGAAQANIVVAQAAPPSTDPAAVELEIANSILGGEFGSRLNMNLREDKHWAYGSYANLSDAVGPRTWRASAAVQIDKAAESIQELRREIADYVGSKSPPRAEELATAVGNQVRTMPGSYETGGAVLAALSDLTTFGRPDDYPQQRARRVSALSVAQVHAAARSLQPQALTWIVVGDLKKIEAPIRALAIGDVQVVDADGRKLR